MLERSLVRIFHSNGFAEGVGFLIDPGHVLTCAHVVASALGLKTYPDMPPTGEISLDFPLLTPGQKLTARIVTWQIPANGQGDVAVLEITSSLPEKATPARLIQSADLWHHTFLAFGFPKKHENGTWATGRILGAKAGGWQQIESTEQTGYFVQPGFSGGPVWDERLGGVVGMIMEAETATRAAFMSPVGVLAGAYPPLAEKIEQIISPASDTPAPGEPPFKGLLYFDVQDAPLFFGRETLTQELAQRLSQEGSNFLAIVGASGSGKSSLARAGLIPALMAKNPGWFYRIITPTAHPLKELAVTLTVDVESVTAATTLIDDLTADPRSLDIAASRFLKRQNAPHLLLVVDQFEELFTACKDIPERKSFIDNLLNAVGLHQTSEGNDKSLETSKVSIVLTLRADFYHHCAQYDNLRAALEAHQAYIGPMNTDELRRAIEAPAHKNGWDFEPGLIDVMLHDVNEEPGALPLLSHALLGTWQRRKGREMTLAGYHATGGVRGAIAQTADQVYATLPGDSQRIARDIFLRLTELGEGTQDTRRRASLDELIPNLERRAEIESVLKILADARLVTLEKDTAEVTHEALIREWPALQEWLDNNREGLRLHRHLTDAANEWQGMRRDVEELYRGARLSQALEWVEEEKPALNELERVFLETSKVEEQKKEAEREAILQRELEQAKRLAEEEKKSAKAQRQRSIYLAAALIIAVFLGVLSFVLFQSSNQNLQIARTGELSAQALLQIKAQDDLAMLLSIEAYSSDVSLQTRQALYEIWTYSPELLHITRVQSNEPEHIVFSPDGRMVASSFSDGTILFWDTKTGQLLRKPLSAFITPLLSLAFSPDGHILASGSSDSTIQLWNVQTGQLLGEPSYEQYDFIWNLAFSPDGHILASGSSDGTIQLWNVQTGKPLGEPLSDHSSRISSLAFSPDGHILASGSSDGTIQLWNVQTGKPLGEPLSDHSSGISSLAFSPDGQMLASGSDDATIQLWNVQTGKPLGKPLTGHDGSILSLAFSPDGYLLASSSDDTTIRLWYVQSGRLRQEPFIGHTNEVLSVVFSSDGQTLVSASKDNTIRLWSVKPEHPLSRQVTGDFADVFSMAFSPNGQMLASGSSDGTIQLWDVQTGQALGQPLSGLNGLVNSVAFSPDGRMLASGSTDDTVQLWDMQTGDSLGEPLAEYKVFGDSVAFSPDGQILASGSWVKGLIRLWDVQTGQQLDKQFIGHTDGVMSVAFSPDGQTLASGSKDKTIRLWDVQTGQSLGEPLTRHTGWVNSVVFSPDGERLASGSSDGTVWLWNVKTLEPIAGPLTGHIGEVESVAFSPDGQTLASSSSLDAIVRLWNGKTGLLLGELLTWHFNGVSSVVFSPDGQTMASGGTTIRLWGVTPKSWVAFTCQRAGRNLTEAEWNQYLYWKPFDPTYKTCPEWPSAAELSLTPTP